MKIQKIKEKRSYLYENEITFSSLLRRIVLLTPIIGLYPMPIKACSTEELGDTIELSGDVAIDTTPHIKEPVPEAPNSTVVTTVCVMVTSGLICLVSALNIKKIKQNISDGQEDKQSKNLKMWKLISISMAIVFALSLLLTIAMMIWRI